MDTPLDLSRQLGSIRQEAWKLIPQENNQTDIKNLEIDSLDALFDVDVQDFFSLPSDNEKKMDKRDSSKVELETIQAIYIPIEPKELTYVGTQLPFYNLKTNIFGNENWLNIKLLNQKVIGPHVQGLRVASDFLFVNINEEDDLYINYYNLAFEQMKFFENVLGNNYFNKKQLAHKLRNQEGYFGRNLTIILSGINKNENKAVQILQYQNQKMIVNGVIEDDQIRMKDQ